MNSYNKLSYGSANLLVVKLSYEEVLGYRKPEVICLSYGVFAVIGFSTKEGQIFIVYFIRNLFQFTLSDVTSPKYHNIFLVS